MGCPHNKCAFCMVYKKGLHTGCGRTVKSDHYTNYVDIQGHLPGDRERMLARIDGALSRDLDSFRPVYVGTG